jgi:hypothetical protein
MKMRLFLAGCALALATSAPAFADTINFGQFGSEFQTLPNTLHGHTADGVDFTVSVPGDGFEILVEGSSWAGEFNAGAPLLYNREQPGEAVTFQFASPLDSLTSLSIQANATGPYTAFVGVYSGATFINTFQYSGVNNLGPEGTIPSFDIPVSGFDKLIITTTNDGLGWALGGVVGPVGGGVPEPASWALMIVGFAAAGAMLRARTRPAPRAI